MTKSKKRKPRSERAKNPAQAFVEASQPVTDEERDLHKQNQIVMTEEKKKGKFGAFLKKVIKAPIVKDVASAALDVLPIPNILRFIPDRNQDGKRDLKDVRWFELAAGVGILALLIQWGLVDPSVVAELIQLFINGD